MRENMRPRPRTPAPAGALGATDAHDCSRFLDYRSISQTSPLKSPRTRMISSGVAIGAVPAR
jgi:hypothetical protein